MLSPGDRPRHAKSPCSLSVGASDQALPRSSRNLITGSKSSGICVTASPRGRRRSIIARRATTAATTATLISAFLLKRLTNSKASGRRPGATFVMTRTWAAHLVFGTADAEGTEILHGRNVKIVR
jgi:hypothetical protein